MLAYLSGRQQPPADLRRGLPARLRCRNERPRFLIPRLPRRRGSLLNMRPRPSLRRRRQIEPQASAPAGRDEIARKLLDIVRERTGYPLEVLRLELDLEAELGIDSIKRVEILGKLRDAFPQLGNAADPEAMDRLASAKTLAAIVDRVERAMGKGNARRLSSSSAASTLAS